MKKLIRFFELLWFPRVTMRLPNDSGATDYQGRRYGAYFWFAVRIGHYHFELFPKHCRGFWMSIWAREYWDL